MDTDAKTFSTNGHSVVDWVVSYWNSLHDGRVPLASAARPGELFSDLVAQSRSSGEPEPLEKIMEDFGKYIMPSTLHWMSRHFHAYFPCGNSQASLLADLISGAINAIGFSWVSNPSGTELEMFVIDWLAKLMGLPNEFLFQSGGPGGGTIISSASEATLLALLSAREKTIRRSPSHNPYDVMSRLVGYTSKEAHSSVRRAGLFARIPIRLINLERRTHRLDPNALRLAVEADVANGLIPFFVCATTGTTGVCAIDSLKDIGPLCMKYDIWLHVDAAYGGNALICPEYQAFLDGVEYVDSLVVSPHKWMMVNYDCSVMWFRSRKDISDPFLVDPEYLKTPNSSRSDLVPDFRHFGIPCGRRFRALKLWFVLRLEGLTKLQENIRKQVQHGNHFAKLVSQDDRFQVVTNSLGVVGFRLKGRNNLTERLLTEVNRSGKIRVIHTKVGWKFIIRFVASGTRSDASDVAFAWETIRETQNQLENVDALLGSTKSSKSSIKRCQQRKRSFDDDQIFGFNTVLTDTTEKDLTDSLSKFSALFDDGDD